jgi:hypothetical protein
MKGLHRHAGAAQPVQVCPRQAVAADLVVQQVDAHARCGALQQPFAQLAADAVVAQDVELHQHVLAGRGDAGEDGREGGRAVDQQRSVIAVGEGQLGQAFERHVLRVRCASEQIVPSQRRLRALLRGPRHGEVRTPRRDVVAEPALTEHQEQRQRQQRKRDQGQRPRRRSLGGACLHHGLARGEQAEYLDRGVCESEHLRAPALIPPRAARARQAAPGHRAHAVASKRHPAPAPPQPARRPSPAR